MPLQEPSGSGRPVTMSPTLTGAGNRSAFLVHLPSNGTRSQRSVGEESKFCHSAGAERPHPYCAYIFSFPITHFLAEGERTPLPATEPLREAPALKQTNQV